MRIDLEENVKALVKAFVAGQQGRYREHCSDTMLAALLFEQLASASWRDPLRSRAELIVEGVLGEAYEVGAKVFERILEHGCRALGNGHHVAQAFSEAMAPLVAKKEQG